MDWGKLFSSDKVTVAEFIGIFMFLIHNNIAFEVLFTPRDQINFATLGLTISINPRMETSIEITLTDA